MPVAQILAKKNAVPPDIPDKISFIIPRFFIPLYFIFSLTKENMQQAQADIDAASASPSTPILPDKIKLKDMFIIIPPTAEITGVLESITE